MGRDRREERHGEHWTKMQRATMQTPAWRALSPVAQALYPWLKFEWKGPRANNNGRIRLSVRQASERLGVSRQTAARAFHDLQEKGFIVTTEAARLGYSGEAKAPAFELTELALPGSGTPRKLFASWRPGTGFPIARTLANNPKGWNGKEKTCHQNHDSAVIEFRTKLP